MSRTLGQPPTGNSTAGATGEDAPPDVAQIAEDIGIAALDLAERANAAGLTTIGFLLESVALEAGAEAAATRRPADSAQGATLPLPAQRSRRARAFTTPQRR